MDFWMQNGANPGMHTIVDCGPWSERQTQRRFEQLRKFVGLSQCLRVGNDRLIVRLPLRVRDKVLAAIPEIKAGAAGYCWCTHGFTE